MMGKDKNAHMKEMAEKANHMMVQQIELNIDINPGVIMDDALGEKRRAHGGKKDGGSFKNSNFAKGKMSLADYKSHVGKRSFHPGHEQS